MCDQFRSRPSIDVNQHGSPVASRSFRLNHHAQPSTRTRDAYAHLPGTPSQIRAVRASLRALLPDCPRADDAILAASELAANAALHSNSRHPGGSFTVRAEIHPGSHIRIEIDDDGGPWTEPAPNRDRPHGLDIIRALAADWGNPRHHHRPHRLDPARMARYMTAAQQRDSQQPTDKRAILTAAEQFLADTAESVHPDLPAPALLEYTALYRAPLAALVAACRYQDHDQ
jgi:serine/threonine-protein kinase RsbW